MEKGDVLLAGGQNDGANGGYLASAELCNPSTGKFTLTGSLNQARISAYGSPAPRWAHLLPVEKCSSLLATTKVRSRPTVQPFDRNVQLWLQSEHRPPGIQGYAAVEFSNGEVLDVGGYQSQAGTYLGYLGKRLGYLASARTDH